MLSLVLIGCGSGVDPVASTGGPSEAPLPAPELPVEPGEEGPVEDTGWNGFPHYDEPEPAPLVEGVVTEGLPPLATCSLMGTTPARSRSHLPPVLSGLRDGSLSVTPALEKAHLRTGGKSLYFPNVDEVATRLFATSTSILNGSRLEVFVAEPTVLVLTSRDAVSWDLDVTGPGEIVTIYLSNGAHLPVTISGSAAPVTLLTQWTQDIDFVSTAALVTELGDLGVTLDSMHSDHHVLENAMFADGLMQFEAGGSVAVQPIPTCAPAQPWHGRDPSWIRDHCEFEDPTICNFGHIDWSSEAEDALAMGFPSGESCRLAEPAQARGRRPLSDRRVYGGRYEYGCDATNHLYRADLETGARDESWMVCRQLAITECGLILQSPGLIDAHELVAYPSFEEASCGLHGIQLPSLPVSLAPISNEPFANGLWAPTEGGMLALQFPDREWRFLPFDGQPDQLPRPEVDLDVMAIDIGGAGSFALATPWPQRLWRFDAQMVHERVANLGEDKFSVTCERASD